MPPPSPPVEKGRALSRRQEITHEVIFGADTYSGKLFDIVLLFLIVLSVLTVILESVPSIREQYTFLIDLLEWIFTIAFTIEYLLRIWCARRRLRYITSFYGVVDFLAIMPTYLSLLVPGSHTLLTIRALRLLRIFRIFKLGRYMAEASVLRRALFASRQKIVIFILTVATILVIAASAMYLLEGGTNPAFDSIPDTLYWAVVTMTTVGYGDATPITVPGKVLAAIMMLIGYSLIIVPTGILTAEMSHAMQPSAAPCPECETGPLSPNDRFCRHCGRPCT